MTGRQDATSMVMWVSCDHNSSGLDMCLALRGDTIVTLEH